MGTAGGARSMILQSGFFSLRYSLDETGFETQEPS